jgi:hypothetical protein
MSAKDSPFKGEMGRIWKAGAEDSGTVHCMGNGSLCVYETGPDILQVVGPPYSAPSLMAANLTAPANLAAVSVRTPSAAVMTHRLDADGSPCATFTDFVDADLACFVRRVETRVPLEITCRLHEKGTVATPLASGNGIVFEMPSGAFIYNTYPFPSPIFHQMLWSGPVRCETDPDNDTVRLTVGPGESVLYLAGGPDYPAARTTSEEAANLGWEALHRRTVVAWQAFRAGGHDGGALLPESLPRRDELFRRLDDVAVLIRAQQAREGAVLAGYPYHLGYVRDQFGVARGLIRLGHAGAAREVLEFYWQIWQRHGFIRNAQGIGVPNVFHVHENDDVEITGYLVCQAFDLLDATGDEDFMRTVFPMLEWALEAQTRHLVDGMLPFNGDETYVACGILPRTTLNDGSAEATLLFVHGGRKLLAWARTHGLWNDAAHQRLAAAVDDTAARFSANFILDGEIATNIPSRAAAAPLPRFRHGVCMSCSAPNPQGIRWTRRTENDFYRCPHCAEKEPLPAVAPVPYFLPSVGLTPNYFHADLIDPAVTGRVIGRVAEECAALGRMPSRPGSTACIGYDYGLLLYNLAVTGHPRADTLYHRTLDMADEAGSWSEVYDGDMHRGTRCRPWESGISIEGLLEYAKRHAGG